MIRDMVFNYALTLGVVAFGPVVSRSALTVHKGIRSEEVGQGS